METADIAGAAGRKPVVVAFVSNGQQPGMAPHPRQAISLEAARMAADEGAEVAWVETGPPDDTASVWLTRWAPTADAVGGTGGLHREDLAGQRLSTLLAPRHRRHRRARSEEVALQAVDGWRGDLVIVDVGEETTPDLFASVVGKAHGIVAVTRRSDIEMSATAGLCEKVDALGGAALRVAVIAGGAFWGPLGGRWGRWAGVGGPAGKSWDAAHATDWRWAGGHDWKPALRAILDLAGWDIPDGAEGPRHSREPGTEPGDQSGDQEDGSDLGGPEGAGGGRTG